MEVFVRKLSVVSAVFLNRDTVLFAEPFKRVFGLHCVLVIQVTQEVHVAEVGVIFHEYRGATHSVSGLLSQNLGDETGLRQDYLINRDARSWEIFIGM